MNVFVDLFGYLSVILHGLAILAQAMTVGGVVFICALALPFEQRLGASGGEILRRARRITVAGALSLAAVEAASLALQAVVLVGTVGASWGDVLMAEFAVAGLVKAAAALAAALLLGRSRPAAWPLLAVAAIILAAATLATHANARLHDRTPLLIVEALHQLGAAIWIGGLPCFVMALRHCAEGRQWRLVGARYSRLSMAGVGCIVVSGAVMTALYVGSLEGLYGTAYGVMVSAKIVTLVMLLGLGGLNFLLVERLRRDPLTPVLRLRRFAEAEIGIGFTLFFAAASVTSSPPAVDLTTDRASWQEIVERNWPVVPRLQSPSHADLAIPALQARLDAEAAAAAKAPPKAVVPGSGEALPRNAEDIAWSEFNHHWAGIFLVAVGLAALAQRVGVRAARHWPLLFLALGGFLLLRSDPEVWPLGPVGILESLRDPEVLQHRLALLAVVAFALFEWRVQAAGLEHGRQALVFPLVAAIGAGLLLTHQHNIANVKDQLLIEITHTPMALLGMAGAWSRWLELRLAPPASLRAGWVWPVCFLLVGLILLDYREA